MKLSSLLGAETAGLAAGTDPDITGVTADSRKAAPGSLFVALAGTRADGASFIADAVAKGAAAVVTA